MAKHNLKLIVRNKFALNFCSVFVDATSETNPDLECEIADLFKQVDESGEVNNFAYSDNQPVRAYQGDFAENETTYQGAYEEYLYGQADTQQQTSERASVASKQANEVVSGSDPDESSGAQ